MVQPDTQRAFAERQAMIDDPYVLDPIAGRVVLAAIQGHCSYRGWNLLAAHVRSNHVHLIVEAGTSPEKIMNESKSYSSRELNQRAGERPGRKRWARHGSTRWLWNDDDVRGALQYVIEGQGEPMALFVADGI